MGNCYSEAVDFHDSVDHMRVKRKDTLAERPSNCCGQISNLNVDIQFDSTPVAPSNIVPFNHNGVAPFTREERVKVIFENQKTMIKKLLTSLKTQNETKPEGETIVVDSALLDKLVHIEGGVAALARQLGINLEQGVDHYASPARYRTAPLSIEATAKVASA